MNDAGCITSLDNSRAEMIVKNKLAHILNGESRCIQPNAVICNLSLQFSSFCVTYTFEAICKLHICHTLTLTVLAAIIERHYQRHRAMSICVTSQPDQALYCWLLVLIIHSVIPATENGLIHINRRMSPVYNFSSLSVKLLSLVSEVANLKH